jgi:hypothetical protein
VKHVNLADVMADVMAAPRARVQQFRELDVSDSELIEPTRLPTQAAEPCDIDPFT